MNLYGIDWQSEDVGKCQYRSNENVDFDDLPQHFDDDIVTQLKGTINPLRDSYNYGVDIYFEVLRFLENVR